MLPLDNPDTAALVAIARCEFALAARNGSVYRAVRQVVELGIELLLLEPLSVLRVEGKSRGIVEHTAAGRLPRELRAGDEPQCAGDQQDQV